MSKSELTALVRTVERSDPHDPEAQGKNLDHICRVADLVRARCPPEIASGLLATAHIIDVLASGTDRFDRKHVHAIACQLLRAMEHALQRFEARPHPPAASAPSAASSPASAPKASTPAAPSWSSPSPSKGPPAAASHGPAAAPAPTTAAGPAPAKSGPTVRPVHPAAITAPRKGLRKETGRLLGRILLELGHVTRAQVADALRFHRAKGIPIGESLLLLGSISPDRLLETLKLQERLRALPAEVIDAKPEEPPPAKAPDSASGKRSRGADLLVTKDMFLGEVLLGAEMITNEQLEQAMHMHHLQGLRVGEALLKIGALSEQELASGLELQRHLCSIALKAARP